MRRNDRPGRRKIHGERAGFNNEESDLQFLDLLENDPARLAAMKHVDHVRLGGAEGAEVIMWLAMRGALGPHIGRLHRNYYLATSTAMAVALYEPVDGSVDAGGAR